MGIVRSFALGFAVVAMSLCSVLPCSARAKRSADEQEAAALRELAKHCVKGEMKWEVAALSNDGDVDVRALGTDWVERALLRKTSMSGLVAYFGATSATDVVARHKTFVVPCKVVDKKAGYPEPIGVLDRFAVEKLHEMRGKVYVPPSDEDVREALAVELVRDKFSTLPLFDERSVAEAMERLYYDDGKGPDRLLADLSRDVRRLSRGRVLLVRVANDPKDNDQYSVRFCLVTNAGDPDKIEIDVYNLAPNSTPVQ